MLFKTIFDIILFIGFCAIISHCDSGRDSEYENFFKFEKDFKNV